MVNYFSQYLRRMKDEDVLIFLLAMQLKEKTVYMTYLTIASCGI